MNQILRWHSHAGPQAELDELAIEEPLEIQLNTQPVCVTMRTPGHDDELAAGFLLSQGVVRYTGDLLAILPSWSNQAGNVIGVFQGNKNTQADYVRLARQSLGSSCKLCGKAVIESIHRHFPPITAHFSIPAEMLLAMPERLRQGQITFQRTGGLHAAAIFTASGELVVLREDVARHNAVDKVLGYGFLNGLLPFDRHVLMLSGRTSFEILQKALAARIPIVAAVSAPSTLAVDFAQANAQTLIGFLRDQRLNIYSHPDRIRFSP